MLYVHEDNIKNKIESDYKGLKNELSIFYNEKYKNFREDMESIIFEDGQINDFIEGNNTITPFSRLIR